MSLVTRNMRRVLWTTAFVVWLCVVWGHSMMPADMSSAESSRFVFLVRPLFELFGNTDEHLMTYVIRKTAHFMEYAALMFIACHMAWAWCEKLKGFLAIACSIWVLVPSVDEVIQLFVPGRDGKPTDVLLDMCGGMLGVLVACAFQRLLNRE